MNNLFLLSIFVLIGEVKAEGKAGQRYTWYVAYDKYT